MLQTVLSALTERKHGLRKDAVRRGENSRVVPTLILVGSMTLDLPGRSLLPGQRNERGEECAKFESLLTNEVLQDQPLGKA